MEGLMDDFMESVDFGTGHWTQKLWTLASGTTYQNGLAEITQVHCPK